MDGQQTIMTAGLQLMRDTDMAPVFALLEQALSAASTPGARNNIRMLRMALRYSYLECRTTNVIDDSNYTNLEVCPDPTGELYYMSHSFDSYHYHDPGFGLMLPLDCKKEADFIPDKWYAFEN